MSMTEGRQCELYNTQDFQFPMDFEIDGQTPRLVLSGRVELYHLPHHGAADETVTAVWVVFDGSSIAAVGDSEAQLAHDDNEDQGYFTESLRLNVSASTSSGDHLPLVANSPATNDGRRSFSSSISFGVGGFGTTPTANLDVSHSTQISVDDFLVTNGSSGTVLDHLYKLGASRDGIYQNPASLVSHAELDATSAALAAKYKAEAMIPGGWFVGLGEGVLRATGILSSEEMLKIVSSPTDAAVHDYAIYSQGVFQTPSDAEGEEVTVTIDFEAIWRRVYIDWHPVLNNSTYPTVETPAFTQSGSHTVTVTL